MLLTITTTYKQATDLGYLLHKNPSRVQSFNLSFGQAHIFYPEASTKRCTIALLLDVDPVKLVRTHKGEGGLLTQYVNDRPYVASSFMSVAIAKIFGSGLKGKCDERPELVDMTLPLEAKVAVLPSNGGEDLIKKLFEPLGYNVSIKSHLLDEKFTDWGKSPYFTVSLKAKVRLQDLLTHLYVLIPVLDDNKHYWVGEDEVEKLLRHGEGWLDTHLEKDLIVKRYLKHQRSLTREALARLAEEDNPDPDTTEAVHSQEEDQMEEKLRLNDQRLQAVMSVLKDRGAKTIIDLGCGEGRLLKLLLQDKTFEKIIGMDVSYSALEAAKRHLRLDELPDRQRERIKLIQSSLSYKDNRLIGYDAATVMEVVEHLDESRLTVFEYVVFDAAKPNTIVITTPNREYNVKFENLAAGAFRHKDHRFEWTRSEFQAWAKKVADRYNYSVKFLPIGQEDSRLGSPTQMGVFTI